MIDIAHVHPMLVHFPIVLFITAVAMHAGLVVRGRDLAERRCAAIASLATLLAGMALALVAATFGDIALDIAREAGFSAAPLEEHEDLATVTMVIFGLLAAIQSFAMWRRVSLTRARGWGVVLTGVVGLGVLLTTAYHGGVLVYELGVNVAGAGS